MTATIVPGESLPAPAAPPEASTDLVAGFAALAAARRDGRAAFAELSDPDAVGRRFIEAYRNGLRSPATLEAPVVVPELAAPVPESVSRVPDTFADPAPAPESAAAGRGGLRRPGRRYAAEPTGLRDHDRRRLITLATWVRNIGAVIILFAAWQLWGTAIAQHHAQSSLQSQFEAKVKAAPHPSGYTLVPASVQYPQPPEGSAMAQLRIPAINLSQYVVSGTAADDLAKGPGHYIGTAMPGQAGNVAIAGHRTTHGAPFNRLAELAVGDPIYLTTVAGQRLTYLVAQPPYPVLPSNTSVLNYFGDDRLTLTTCNPEYSATQRLIVVAQYQAPGASAHPDLSKGSGTPVAVKASGEAGWNMGLVPWVLIELGLLVALGLGNGRLARLLGREGRWLVLVPIWLALFFALFQSLTSFLPAAA